MAKPNQAVEAKYLRHKTTGVIYGWTDRLVEMRGNEFELYRGDPNAPPVPAKPLEDEVEQLKRELATAPDAPPHDPDAEEGQGKDDPGAGAVVTDVQSPEDLAEAIDAIDSMEAAHSLIDQLDLKINLKGATDVDQVKATLLSMVLE